MWREAVAIRNQELQQNSGPLDGTVVRTMELILSKTPHVVLRLSGEGSRAAPRRRGDDGALGRKRHPTFRDGVEGVLDYRFSISAIAHLLHSHGSFLAKLEEFTKPNISYVTFPGSRRSAGL